MHADFIMCCNINNIRKWLDICAEIDSAHCFEHQISTKKQEIYTEEHTIITKRAQANEHIEKFSLFISMHKRIIQPVDKAEKQTKLDDDL